MNRFIKSFIYILTYLLFYFHKPREWDKEQKTGFGYDNEKLKGDWDKIGKDFRKVMNDRK